MPVKFRIEGDEEVLCLTVRPPKQVRAAIAALEALPFELIITTHGLTSRLGINRGYFALYSTDPALRDFKEKQGSRTLWGSRKTIGELRKKKNPNAKESPKPKV